MSEIEFLSTCFKSSQTQLSFVPTIASLLLVLLYCLIPKFPYHKLQPIILPLSALSDLEVGLHAAPIIRRHASFSNVSSITLT